MNKLASRAPMSLRQEADEFLYQQAKKNGDTKPLGEEPSIEEWEHFRLIANRYPYTIAFAQHHMLIPKREVAKLSDLNLMEFVELINILGGFTEDNYDLWFVNTNRKRSILSHFHIHLANYVADRGRMGL